MADVNHNSLRYLTNDDQLAIATYLKTVQSEETLGVKGSTNPPTLARGKEVYYSACTNRIIPAQVNSDHLPGCYWYI
jgi:hypothetical protein